ncbi:MAG: NUDIX domain-containing protein [Candidatus Saccharimonadales bacterium]
MKTLHTTWVILKKGDRVLLGHKKRGFGKGNVNGIGGKLESGETPEQAIVRETSEEIGVTITKFQKVGFIVFDELVYNGERQTCVMHCYIATRWDGEPIETDEIQPEWFNINDIPYKKMWADDEHWLPQVLDGEKVEARFKYNDDFEIVEFHVDILPSNLLATFTDSDFGMKDGDISTYEPRYGARAILLDDKNRVALINATKHNYYKLPGGGIDEAELAREALVRETIEEAGYEADILDNLGQITEYRAKFKQINISYCYLARATKFVDNCLMPDELEDGFELEWFSNIDAAIKAVQKVDTEKLNYQGKFFTARELAFLKSAKSQIA